MKKRDHASIMTVFVAYKLSDYKFLTWPLVSRSVMCDRLVAMLLFAILSPCEPGILRPRGNRMDGLEKEGRL